MSKRHENEVKGSVGSSATGPNLGGDDLRRHTHTVQNVQNVQNPLEMAVPVDWVEGVEKLQAMSRPCAIPAPRWDLFVDVAAWFVKGWAARMAALGWDEASIFGIDAVSALGRPDLAGLLWLVEPGDRVVAITESTIGIRKHSGAMWCFRRPRPFPGDKIVCAWDFRRKLPHKPKRRMAR